MFNRFHCYMFLTGDDFQEGKRNLHLDENGLEITGV